MFVSVISVCSILLTFAPHVVQAQSGLGYDLLPSSKLWTILVSSWIMSFLSLFGSMSVMYLILRKRRWRESGAFSHIMVGTCVADFVTSITIILQGVSLPRATMFPIAIGNIRSCEATGFFFMSPLASAVYNCALTFYFLVTIRYRWTENKTKKYFQPWTHVLAVVSAVCFGVIGLATNSFNPNIITVACGFAPSPGNCLANPNIPCRRGEWAGLLFRLLKSALTLLSICSIVFLWLLYAHVRRQSRRNRRYNFSQTQGTGAAIEKSKQDQAVFVQACFYTFASFSLFLTVIFALIYRSIVVNDKNFDLIEMYSSTHYFLFRVLINVLFPLQGFFNWAIYVRPTLYQWKTAVPEKSFWWAYQQMLRGHQPPPPSHAAHRRTQRATYTGASSLTTTTRSRKIEDDGNNVEEPTEDTDEAVDVKQQDPSSTLLVADDGGDVEADTSKEETPLEDDDDDNNKSSAPLDPDNLFHQASLQAARVDI